MRNDVEKNHLNERMLTTANTKSIDELGLVSVGCCQLLPVAMANGEHYMIYWYRLTSHMLSALLPIDDSKSICFRSRCGCYILFIWLWFNPFDLSENRRAKRNERIFSFVPTQRRYAGQKEKVCVCFSRHRYWLLLLLPSPPAAVADGDGSNL